ncbi:MAG: hypothetical protein JWO56_2366 [Acidobacteria bacterium]|nr:hypothetical protein [Acidobacteriota bacterium]
MSALASAFQLSSLTAAMPLLFAGVLLLILIVSFRARAVVFCQYLETMTGIKLQPAEVRRVFKLRGRNGVREMFLDLLIREDLKEGPIVVPDVIVAGEDLAI